MMPTHSSIARVLWLTMMLWTLCCSPAAAHPHANRLPSEKIAATDQTAELDYYFDLLARTVYDAPLASQQEFMHHLVVLHYQKQDWFQPKDIPAAIERAAQLAQSLKQQLTTVQLQWTAQDVTVIDASPITLAKGLPRAILVELHNDTSQTFTATVTSPTAGATPMAPTSIAPEQKRRLLVTLLTHDLALQEITLTVIPAASSETARSVTIPVEVAEPALVRGKLIEEADQSVFPGKVYAAGPDGIYRHCRDFADNPTVSVKDVIEHLPIGRQYQLPFSYSNGSFEVLLPAGVTTLKLERGYEHPIVTKVIRTELGCTYDVTLLSQRFIDMKARGWISGDTHIHWTKNYWSEDEDINLLALVQRAEDLRVANNLTLFQYRPEEQGGNFIAPAQFPPGPVPGLCDSDYHIQMAEEYRNDNFYGHLNFLNITDLIQPISTGAGSGGPPDAINWPLNKHAIEECRRQGGISIEAHNLGPFHRSDVPANVISGLSDSLDQLKPENYYRFLDCGIRIPLTNGSDHPARLAGQCRAYVKVDGRFTYEKWIDGIRARRTFTTSGPLLFLTVNGADIGSELDVSQGGELIIHARAVSRHPLGKMQLVSNGGAILREIATDRTDAEITMTVTAEQSRWFALRCSQNDNYSALDNPNAAHTSAIYVTVDDQPICHPEAVTFWIELLHRHYDNIAENAHYETPAQRQEQLDYIQSAIERYQNLLGKDK